MKTSDLLIFGGVAFVLYQASTQTSSGPVTVLTPDPPAPKPWLQEPDPTTLPHITQMRFALLQNTMGETYDKIKEMPEYDLRDLYIAVKIYHADPKFMPASLLNRYKALVLKYRFKV